MRSGKDVQFHGMKQIEVPLPLEWGVAHVVLPGQKESGDYYLVKPHDQGILVAVVDGLGHGEEAAAASRKAVQVLDSYVQEPLIQLIRRCHSELQGTRGVVMSVVYIRAFDETMTWLAVGNVETVLFRSDFRSSRQYERVIMRSGVVGHNLPPLIATILPLNQGDTIVFTTDGIKEGYVGEQISSDSQLIGKGVWTASGSVAEMVASQPPQVLADRICSQYAKGNDDALVLVVRYKGTGQ